MPPPLTPRLLPRTPPPPLLRPPPTPPPPLLRLLKPLLPPLRRSKLSARPAQGEGRLRAAFLVSGLPLVTRSPQDLGLPKDFDRAELDWTAEGAPRSQRFDDIYFSR